MFFVLIDLKFVLGCFKGYTVYLSFLRFKTPSLTWSVCFFGAPHDGCPVGVLLLQYIFFVFSVDEPGK